MTSFQQWSSKSSLIAVSRPRSCRQTVQSSTLLLPRQPVSSARDNDHLGDPHMSRLSRRSLVLGASLAPFAAHAQSWPSGPIRIVVPFPPGASVDAVGRLAAAGLQQRLNTNVIVENRPGASGSIGSAVVA